MTDKKINGKKCDFIQAESEAVLLASIKEIEETIKNKVPLDEDISLEEMEELLESTKEILAHVRGEKVEGMKTYHYEVDDKGDGKKLNTQERRASN